MKSKQFVWFNALLLMCIPAIAAATTEDKTANNPDVSILVEPEQLQKNIADKNLRVLDVRPQDDYAEQHIPGSVRVDVGDWKSLAAANNGLHNTKGWSEKISPLGLNRETHVVVYGSKLSNAARIWWLLKYVGVENVSLLNGGWESWAKQGRPTGSSAPKIAATKFTPDFQTDRMEEIDFIKNSLKAKKLQLVDTRSDEEFAGGRIPGSVHLEWKELVDKDGRFKTKNQLQQLFQQRGITPDEAAVCY